MTQNIEQLIDRYFDGQLSATEQTELFRAVDTDSVARQLFDTEQFIRGSFTADASSVPQAAMEPSASLMSKLAATKPATQAASQQAAQQAAQETATQTVAQVGSQAASQIASVAVKSTANMAGKVATTGLAAAGKTIMGLSVGAFQMVAGAVVTVAVATTVILSTGSNSSNDQQVLTPVQDSAAIFSIENKIDTPAAPISSTPAPMTPVTSSKIDVSSSKLPSDAPQQPAAANKPAMPNLMDELPPARHNTSDSAGMKIGTKQGR